VVSWKLSYSYLLLLLFLYVLAMIWCLLAYFQIDPFQWLTWNGGADWVIQLSSNILEWIDLYLRFFVTEIVH